MGFLSFFKKKPKYEVLEEFYTKVVGVTYDNDDGGSRQELLDRSSEGDCISLQWVENEHDKNAVAVVNVDVKGHLGFLPKDTARSVVRGMKEGLEYYCEISEITGGTKGKPTLGANLLVYKTKVTHYS